MWPTLNGMMWHQILFCCHSPDICGTSSSHSLTSPGWYRRRSLISYLSFFQAQTLSVWPLFVSCDIKFISATKRLKGDGKTLSRFSLKRYFLSLENSTITILEVLMLNVFCDHPGVGFLSPTQWLGVVRVNISVIKILTEPGRDGTESKVQISPHSWYEAVNWSHSVLSGVKRTERFPLWCVVCWSCYRRPSRHSQSDILSLIPTWHQWLNIRTSPPLSGN